MKLIFLLCGLALAGWLAGPLCAQQNPNGQIPLAGMTDALLVLIRDPLVQRDLRLNDLQRRAIRQLTDELDGPLWTLRNQPAKQAAEGLQKLIAKAKDRLEPLLTPTQHKRLSQFRLAVAGPQVLLRDDVVSKLKLTDDQRTRIESALKEPQAAAGESSNSGGKAAGGKSKPSANDVSKRISAILTREQLTITRDLLGPPADGSQLGRVKFKAPDLLGDDGWLNSPPLSSEQLRGRVVVVHFWAFGCINCVRNQPHYRAWHEAFAPRGLTIVGIHTPETEAERNVESLQKKADEAGLKFPILIDNQRRNWNAWGNSIWPAVYLIDKQGYVRYWWLGELNWQGAEGEKMLRRRIEELLAEK